MSRVTKWKLEKAKVKVVFRLQFHATHIPQSGWEKLFISFIPTETGKTTAKTSKANVRNGSCKWADPIYETTRLLLDSKSKQYDDKLYRLVVGMGTSRSSILGEATINLADYADATQPSAIGLPLHGSDHGTILHVTVQLLTAKTGFREFEQQRDKGLQSGNNVNRESESSVVKSSSSELQIPDDQVNKAKTHIQLRSQSKELLSVVEETGVREEYSDSQVTCDGSSNASESYYADKHDPYSTHEVDSLKSRVSGSQSSPGDGSNHHKLAQRSGSDYSMDNDLVIAYEENHRLRGSLEVAESSISELKVELSVLQSHANEMGTETEKLAQELATEIASGQELAKEVTVLKSECSKFKNDLEQLKEMKSSSKYMERKIEQSGHQKQLRWVNGVLLVEDRIRELQEKIYIGFRESDFSFLHSDLEVLLSTVQDLKKGTVEALPLQHEALAMNIDEPESMLHFGKIPSSPLQEPGSTGVIDSTEGSHLELLSQLDIAKAERESLVRKMNQMECYYEALVQELEENQKRILGEFQSLRNEHSTCDFTISTCKAESESIRRDMNDQMVRFTEENHELGSINKELQRRATTSESALKRARLNYSIAVSQLQKDLDMLSFQVLSMFETNQNVLKEAFSDPPQHLVEDFQESDDTLVSNLRSKQPSGGDVLSDDLKKSLSLQENIYKKVEEELGEMSSANLYLDVYSGILKETLFEASDHIRKMKGKLEELSQQLELSNQSRDLLFRRLQTAAEDVHSLNGQNAYCLAKCNDLQLQNQMLEADLGNLSNENFLLMEKITECEALLMDYRVYKSKHEVVSAEKLELENLLEIRVLDNQNLRKDMESVKEELETLRSGIHELAISKETIQKDLEKERDIAALSLSAARSEIDDVKRRFKQGLHDMVAKLDTPNASLEKLQFQLDSFANKFKSSLESKERHVQHSEVLLTYLSSLELELQKMSSEDKNFIENIMGLDMMAEEFEMSKLAISELKQENQDLMMHVKNKSEESIKLLPELDRLKECLKCVNDELDVERDLKSKLEGTVASLTSQLESQRSELSHVRKLASDQESENFRVVKLLSLHEESLEKLSKKHSADVSLACQLSEMQETMISEDLKLTFVRSQYETWIEELGKQLQELESKHLDNEARLNQSLASEAHYIEENKELTNALKSLRMELETSVAQNLVFSDSINVLTCELEQYKDKVGVLELSLSNENNQHAVEVGQLKDLLAKSESEVDGLLFSREESEMVSVVLKAKLEEQNDELIMLQNKSAELTKKLAAQILKTEEFKNLSIYLKELKDNADIAREKKDPEGPSESLRMAFVKEQYQTKMQELKQQLSVSKRHGEEMLFKLQDALDEIESRKKSEASQLRRIDELSVKIVELEAELQSATSDKPNYDRIQAELECALLSLECCKEEKEKLVALLQECEEEKSKIVVELSVIREQLAQKEENSVSDKHRHMGLNGSMDYKEVKSATSTQTGEAENPVIPINVRAIQEGVSGSEGVHGVTEHASADEESSLLNDSKQLTVVNDQFRAQHLRSCMEQLDEELEKMKNDNSLLPLTNYDPSFQDLQRELVQLRKANEELGSIYPNFIDLPGNGNALERVLALEIELAEALRTKKKSSIQFQSSFLKQHSDEEAVFKSFRDINELIKDMLEIKGKYVNVETELKEMHDRYSQLSLQFAEVEGERQKLMMTLKNVRSSRNMLRLNRSPIPIPTLEDHHPL
ncbi:WEB family protein At4g27595, chloroplastic [Cynara cardunculus var. scolymus]|uniref:WEB family protein At4g27595, chloroplastic n=1 Tax=Cynara cardunculus var. scolymus TaxID=59895 RepID=UPI000D630BD5|nr:WEB family protein At4g27595, chloroplastic [Cynara cardunculus var. scolymus]